MYRKTGKLQITEYLLVNWFTTALRLFDEVHHNLDGTTKSGIVYYWSVTTIRGRYMVSSWHHSHIVVTALQ